MESYDLDRQEVENRRWKLFRVDDEGGNLGPRVTWNLRLQQRQSEPADAPFQGILTIRDELLLREYLLKGKLLTTKTDS